MTSSTPYNETVQAHYRHPHNLGPLAAATARARTWRGDAMLEFHLRVAQGVIEAASFRAIGCAGTVAAGSAMTGWLMGRTVAEAQRVTAQTVLDLLGGLPPDRLYCADFAAQAVRAVVERASDGTRDSQAQED